MHSQRTWISAAKYRAQICRYAPLSAFASQRSDRKDGGRYPSRERRRRRRPAVAKATLSPAIIMQFLPEVSSWSYEVAAGNRNKFLSHFYPDRAPSDRGISTPAFYCVCVAVARLVVSGRDSGVPAKFPISRGKRAKASPSLGRLFRARTMLRRYRGSPRSKRFFSK